MADKTGLMQIHMHLSLKVAHREAMSDQFSDSPFLDLRTLTFFLYNACILF